MPWWSVFNNQMSAFPVVLQAPNKQAAIRKYVIQTTGSPDTGSRTGTQADGPFKTKAEAIKDSQKHGGAGSTVGGGAARDIAHGFDWANVLLRVGEVLLGIVLVGVGIARITGVQNAVSQIVKTKVPV